jgi:hypothetical protein
VGFEDMKKHRTTIILFALASFYYLTTDVILTDETASLLGQEKVIPVYAAAMLSLAAGFALFAFLHKRTATLFSRRLMLSVVFASSALALFGFVLLKNPVIFLSFFVTHMLATLSKTEEWSLMSQKSADRSQNEGTGEII